MHTWVGWSASCTTPTRSSRTASKSTVCRSRAVNAVTTASALYRDPLNRRSTARCTRLREQRAHRGGRYHAWQTGWVDLRMAI